LISALFACRPRPINTLLALPNPRSEADGRESRSLASNQAALQRRTRSNHTRTCPASAEAGHHARRTARPTHGPLATRTLSGESPTPTSLADVSSPFEAKSYTPRAMPGRPRKHGLPPASTISSVRHSDTRIALYHTPGSRRQRTRWRYSRYPSSRSASTRSSRPVRSVKSAAPASAGSSAQGEPRANGIARWATSAPA